MKKLIISLIFASIGISMISQSEAVITLNDTKEPTDIVLWLQNRKNSVKHLADKTINKDSFPDTVIDISDTNQWISSWTKIMTEGEKIACKLERNNGTHIFPLDTFIVNDELLDMGIKRSPHNCKIDSSKLIVEAVPEPETILLLLFGLIGFCNQLSQNFPSKGLIP